MLCPAPHAVEIIENCSVEEILNNYHARIADIDKVEASTSRYSLTAEHERIQIKQEALEELTSAGYQAYDVNPDTYDSVEELLQTDLSELGIDSTGSYIVVLSGDPENNNAVAPAAIVPAPDYGGGSGFSYTYGGVTYSMRYISVYADEGYRYAVSQDIDLIDKLSVDVSELGDLLDSVMTISLDALTEYIPVGSIMEICGLELYNFNPSMPISMTYNANTNWTRLFTQVWDNYYSKWVNASSVEYVTSQSYISGDYFDRYINGFAQVPDYKRTYTVYSEQYYNYAWRKQNAVIGFLNFACIYDTTGPVKYYHDGVLVATHNNYGSP